MYTRLHTADIKGLRVHVLLHTVRGWFRVRMALFSGMVADNSGVEYRRFLYGAAALLTPWCWHGAFVPFDALLKSGRSAGKTFNTSGFRCYQNRFLVVALPTILRWCVPAAVRRTVAPEEKRWRIEVYCLGGRQRKTGEYASYGLFLEWCPQNPPPPARKCLGSELVWRLFGRYKAYVLYLTTSRVPGIIDRFILWTARCLGLAMALFAVLLLFPFGHLARRVADLSK